MQMRAQWRTMLPIGVMEKVQCEMKMHLRGTKQNGLQLGS
jgi:hypothetical protein